MTLPFLPAVLPTVTGTVLEALRQLEHHPALQSSALHYALTVQRAQRHAEQAVSDPEADPVDAILRLTNAEAALHAVAHVLLLTLDPAPPPLELHLAVTAVLYRAATGQHHTWHPGRSLPA